MLHLNVKFTKQLYLFISDAHPNSHESSWVKLKDSQTGSTSISINSTKDSNLSLDSRVNIRSTTNAELRTNLAKFASEKD